MELDACNLLEFLLQADKGFCTSCGPGEGDFDPVVDSTSEIWVLENVFYRFAR